MKYTKEQRLEIAEAFRDAQKRIQSRHNTYICFALRDCCAKAKKEATGVVRSKMNVNDETFSLEGWLLKHSIAKHSWIYGTEEAREQMRLYRLRWLDALIEEFGK